MIFCILLFCSAAKGSDDAAAGAVHDKSGEQTPAVQEYLSNIPHDLYSGWSAVFSQNNLSPALTGIGLSGLAITLDNEVKDYFQDERPLRHISNIGDIAGTAYVPPGIGAGLFLAGEILNDGKLADTGIVTVEATLVSGMIVLGLKYAVGRERPDESDDKSFPSNHATGTAALAASISEMYDWDAKIAVPLYALTAFVGASRLDDNEHYLSDVVGGIALGTIIGRGFAESYKERRGAVRRAYIIPLYDTEHKGLMAGYVF